VLVQDGAVGTVVTGNEITGNSANGVAVVSGLDGETSHRDHRNSIHDNARARNRSRHGRRDAERQGRRRLGPEPLQNFPILGVPIGRAAR
jgi:hypothetical protein